MSDTIPKRGPKSMPPLLDKVLTKWTLKFGIVLIIFLLFYVPVQREASILSSRSRSMREQIAALKKMSENLLTAKELEETTERLGRFETRLMELSQAGKLLDHISEEAQRNHVDLVQIYSDNASPIKDDSGVELEINGKKLMWLPVGFRAETDYKNFGNFMKSIEENAPADFVLVSLTVQRAPAPSANVQCDVTLSFIAK